MRRGNSQSLALIDYGNAGYEDTGCPDLGIPACLACPLPACRYDLPPKQAGKLMRLSQLAPLLSSGMNHDAIAVAIGVSRRTIFRLKREYLALYTRCTTPTTPGLDGAPRFRPVQWS